MINDTRVRAEFRSYVEVWKQSRVIRPLAWPTIVDTGEHTVQHIFLRCSDCQIRWSDGMQCLISENGGYHCDSIWLLIDLADNNNRYGWLVGP